MPEYTPPVPAFIIDPPPGSSRPPRFIATVAGIAATEVPPGATVRRLEPPPEIVAEAVAAKLPAGHRPVPDWLPRHPDHYGVTRSIGDYSLTHVSFWASAWDAVHSTRKRLPVARYLAALPDPPLPHVISDMAARFEAEGAGDADVVITRDFGAIMEAYDTPVSAGGSGGTSCMCSRAGARAAAYAYGGAGSNLAVAILYDDGAVTARTVVWPERQLYVRIYATTPTQAARMRVWLTAHGYERGDDWAGARVHLELASDDDDDEEDGPCVYLPYLDFCQYVDAAGYCHYQRPPGGYYDANKTDGVIYWTASHVWCDACGHSVPEEDTSPLLEGGLVCRSCIEDNDAVDYCQHNGQYTRLETYLVATGWCGDLLTHEWWSGSAVDAHAYWCAATQHYYSHHITAVPLPDGTRAALVPAWRAGRIRIAGYDAHGRPVWEYAA